MPDDRQYPPPPPGERHGPQLVAADDDYPLPCKPGCLREVVRSHVRGPDCVYCTVEAEGPGPGGTRRRGDRLDLGCRPRTVPGPTVGGCRLGGSPASSHRASELNPGPSRRHLAQVRRSMRACDYLARRENNRAFLVVVEDHLKDQVGRRSFRGAGSRPRHHQDASAEVGGAFPHTDNRSSRMRSRIP